MKYQQRIPASVLHMYQEITGVWAAFRKSNQGIPDEVLDLMKDAAHRELMQPYQLQPSEVKPPEELVKELREEIFDSCELQDASGYDVAAARCAAILQREIEADRHLLKEAQQVIRRLKRSMMAHPDYVEGSEFDDYTTLAQEMEDKIEQALNPES